ncbi:MAG: hypothetical protein ABW321_28010 [Polyangiales bacterium]
MHQPTAQGRQDPHSLAPIQLEGTSVEEDAAKIRGGRGLRMTLTVVSLGAAIVGGTQLLRAMDTQQAYAQAAAQLEHVDTQESEAHLRCALPNLQRSQLDTQAAMHNAIEIASERMDKGYGKLLAKCTPLLESFTASVDGIRAPANMTQKLRALSNSAGELNRSWSAYRDYLQRPGQPYDYVQAAPMIEKITTAWQGYRSADRQTREALARHR